MKVNIFEISNLDKPILWAARQAFYHLPMYKATSVLVDVNYPGNSINDTDMLGKIYLPDNYTNSYFNTILTTMPLKNPFSIKSLDDIEYSYKNTTENIVTITFGNMAPGVFINDDAPIVKVPPGSSFIVGKNSIKGESFIAATGCNSLRICHEREIDLNKKIVYKTFYDVKTIYKHFIEFFNSSINSVIEQYKNKEFVSKTPISTIRKDLWIHDLILKIYNSSSDVKIYNSIRLFVYSNKEIDEKGSLHISVEDDFDISVFSKYFKKVKIEFKELEGYSIPKYGVMSRSAPEVYNHCETCGFNLSNYYSDSTLKIIKKKLKPPTFTCISKLGEHSPGENISKYFIDNKIDLKCCQARLLSHLSCINPDQPLE